MPVPNGYTLDPPQQTPTIRLPKGYVLDPPQAAPTIRLPKGYVLDQPQAQQPAQPQQPSLAAGPDNTEGTYAMWNGQGQKVQVPYSNVGKARSQGFQFDTNPGPSGLTPQAQYQRDLGADPTIDKFQRQPSYLEELEAMLHPFNSLESASQPVMRPRNATMGEMVGADLHNVGAGAASVLRHPIRTAVGGVASIGGLVTAPVESALGKENELQQIYDQIRNNGPQFGAYSIGQGLAAGAAGDLIPESIYSLPGKAAGAMTRGAGDVLRFAGSTPAGRAVAATRTLVQDKPVPMLTRALKPSVVNEDFPGQVDRSLPEIVKQNPSGGVQGFANAARSAQAGHQAWYQSLFDGNRGRPVSFKPAYGAQVKSVPFISKVEDPDIFGTSAAGKPVLTRKGIATRTEEAAANYLPQKGVPANQSARTLQDADRLRMDSNRRLASFYAKTNGDKYAALADPRIAREEALANSLRDITYGGLSDATGVPQEEIARRQSLYGDLGEVSSVAQKRATVFGRQNPVSLQESIAMNGRPLGGAISWAAQHGLKALTNSDALVNAALDRYNSPETPTMPARSSVYGRTVSRAGNAIRKAGKSLPGKINARFTRPMAGASVRLAPFAVGAAASKPWAAFTPPRR